MTTTPHDSVPIRCERCNEALKPKNIVWLSLNTRTGKYTDKEISVAHSPHRMETRLDRHLDRRERTAEMTTEENRMHVSADEFVKIWQTSSTGKEVANRVGSSLNAVVVRAYQLRRLGVPLKRMKSAGERLDIPTLKALAESLNGTNPK